jgi:phage FluMu protein Com
MSKIKCGKCGRVWDKSQLLYEPILTMWKCPQCQIFTTLISIEEEGELQ